MKQLFAVLLGLLICSGASAGTIIKPGAIPPAYLGKTLSGKKVSLSALRGDVVVISFWATWCHYCIRELPIWANIQKIAAQKKLHLQVVAIDYMEGRHIFYRAVQILKPRIPGLLITSDPRGKIGKPYGVEGIPFLVMLHRNGKVAYVHVGYDKSEINTLVKEVNVLLNEPVEKQTQ